MENTLPENFSSLPAQEALVKELFPEMLRVLLKDLHSAGIDAEPDNAATGIFSLRDQLQEIIRRAGGLASEKTAQLLYRVDVPQKQVAAIVSGNDAAAFETKLAEAIIIRELQKAWYRKKFRS